MIGITSALWTFQWPLAAASIKSYDFDLEGVSEKFRYLKFSITSNYGSDTYVHGSEITLWGLDNVD